MLSATDLIVAPATPAGPGARAVVRLAGEGLAATLAALFAAEPPGFAVTGGPRLVSARLSATGLGRDWGPLEVVVLHWPGPGGPVGGPLAEVQLPASVPLVNALVAEACRQGCRIARGGEFTLRAFLAGRLDLVQAEAVLAVVDAATPEQLSVALDRMVVGGGAGLATARDALLDLLADIEAAIDFADETAPDGVPVGPAWPAIAARLAACDAVIDAVAGRLATRDASGTDLPRVVIAGPPNVGKSSLFNTLLGRPAALVADERGTTRDALESTFGDASGARCLLVDLAGLGSDDEPPAGAVAGAAAERARAELVGADVVVACQDALDDAKPVGTPADVVRIDVVTRGDRGAAASGGRRLVTSSRTGAGIEALRAAILDAVAALPPRGTPASARLAVGCCEARRAVAAAAAAAATAVGGGFVDESIVAGHLRRAADALAEVTGATIDGDLIDRIFSRHCVGK